MNPKKSSPTSFRVCSTIFERARRMGEVAHICIDPQDYFVSRQNFAILNKIGGTVIPVLRALGVPTYLVYLTNAGRISRAINREYVHAVIPKDFSSAFDGTNLDTVLRQENKKILLLSGFARRVCVYRSFEHATRLGYHPVLLSDCTDVFLAGQVDDQEMLISFKHHCPAKRVFHALGLER